MTLAERFAVAGSPQAHRPRASAPTFATRLSAFVRLPRPSAALRARALPAQLDLSALQPHEEIESVEAAAFERPSPRHNAQPSATTMMSAPVDVRIAVFEPELAVREVEDRSLTNVSLPIEQNRALPRPPHPPADLLSTPLRTIDSAVSEPRARDTATQMDHLQSVTHTEHEAILHRTRESVVEVLNAATQPVRAAHHAAPNAAPTPAVARQAIGDEQTNVTREARDDIEPAKQSQGELHRVEAHATTRRDSRDVMSAIAPMGTPVIARAQVVAPSNVQPTHAALIERLQSAQTNTTSRDSVRIGSVQVVVRPSAPRAPVIAPTPVAIPSAPSQVNTSRPTFKNPWLARRRMD